MNCQQIRFSIAFQSKNARPAVYAFDGDVYTGLDAYSLKEAQLPLLQEKLRISGLYGLLKPLDLIQAYRLEMGTKMPVGVKKTFPLLKDKVTQQLNKEMKGADYLLNLASNNILLP